MYLCLFLGHVIIPAAFSPPISISMSSDHTRVSGDIIQVHMLVTYPAVLLNRDDAGLAKRMPWGGVMRTRVSSQCLKKHWRESDLMLEQGGMAVRSTRIYEDLVGIPLVENHGATPEEASAIAQYLMAETVDTKEAKKAGQIVSARSSQLLVLTRAEIAWLAARAVDIFQRLRSSGQRASKPDEVKKHAPLDKGALAAARTLASDIDTAMFGRMVTSDHFSRMDSSVSVAHALTTHGEETEVDYFTAVDTLTPSDEPGAGLLQDTELTSGTFYLYSTIDIRQLASNLGAREDLIDPLVRAYIRTMATVSPGAKRGSTAPYARATTVLLERGSAQPRSLAGAFERPVTGPSQSTASGRALLEYRRKIDAMYPEDLPAKAALMMMEDASTDTTGIHVVGTLPSALDHVLR